VPINVLADTESYSLCMARGENSADPVLCRIAKSEIASSVCIAEQKWLKRLFELSKTLEQDNRGTSPHYDWLFPVCTQGFPAKELEGNRINVYSVADGVPDDLMSFAKLEAEVKVDVRSAAWVLRRFLKLQAFLDDAKSQHSLNFDSELALISPKTRRVVYFGWFDELLYGGDRSNERTELISKFNINHMFRVILDWVKKNNGPGEDEFLGWLDEHMNNYDDGTKAYAEYCNFLDSLWGRWYHPFTIYKDGSWKNLNTFV
jgi:hypothetical protein